VARNSISAPQRYFSKQILSPKPALYFHKNIMRYHRRSSRILEIYWREIAALFDLTPHRAHILKHGHKYAETSFKLRLAEFIGFDLR
jgi:hypothetical protein